MAKKNIVAVLTTTVIPNDGIYYVGALDKCPDIVGVPHYVGHPDTRSIVESLGAVQAKSKLFTGLNPGEQAICFPIKQGKSSRAVKGFTDPHQAVKLEDLEVRIITRLDGASFCPFCGADTLGLWYCPGCGAS